jgi:NADPH:quinone reductase-like Zn-dependent oxidoreductase
MPETMFALQMSKFSSMSGDAPAKPSLNLVTLPVPSAPPGSLLVRIHATQINPSDAANANGYFPYTTYPRVPGRDFAGSVVSGPDHLRGTRVFASSGREFSFSRDGADAEYCVVPEDCVVPIPEKLNFVQASMIGVPFTTAWIALERARVKAQDSVLVIGAYGAVGTAVCQLAKARGATVITGARRDTADVNLVTDPKMEGARALTGGAGPSVVIDTVGDVDIMGRALKVLAKRGRLSYISAPKTYSAKFSFDMKAVYRAEKEIIGCNSLNYTMKETADILRLLAPGFASGEYQPIDRKITEIKLGEEALIAYKEVMTGEGQKYVICP